ncbi:efflux RND transporter periplasmic adaptor subunit [Halonatronum saccharophilum]|uniref:efflux RND transporter periplasmic adaptor subunit n=1 Tax=Halonatronum saccharophilum TaxID=150060 RepID=UPI00048045F5|nr:efflux RND transporter periplasmic adaptor subunit [Halonatronum saccharophilum]
MRKRVVISLLIVLILGSSLFIWNRSRTRREDLSSTNSLSSSNLVEVERGDLERVILGSGHLQPVRVREFSLNNDNIVEEINVKEGDRVEVDDLLIRMSNDRERLDYFKAQNNYERALINGLRSEIDEAELNLRVAQRDLRETDIKAPFSGVVTRVEVEEGEQIRSGNLLLEVIDNRAFKLEIEVGEGQSGEIELGQRARVNIPSLSSRRLEGEVVKISQVGKNNSGVVTLPVTILIEEGVKAVRPNFSAEAEVIVERVENKIVVPITAIFREGREEKVVKVIDGKMKPVNVKTGISNGMRIVVEEGLDQGDQILVNAYSYSIEVQNVEGRVPRGGMRF